MSTFIELQIPCPACGQLSPRQVATSVNIARLPEAHDEILNDTFQRFDCDHCGAPSPAFVPFVYIDFDRGYMIDVRSPTEEHRWGELEHEPVDAFERYLGADAPELPRAIGEGMVVRIVFGLPALREKLVTFDNGLDDTALEALKLRLMIEAGDVDIDARLRLLGLAGDHLVLVGPRTDARGVPTVVREVDVATYDAIRDDPTVRSDIIAVLDAPYCDVARLLAA